MSRFGPISAGKLLELKSFWREFSPSEYAEMKMHWDRMCGVDPDGGPIAIRQRWAHFARYCDVRDRQSPGTTANRYDKQAMHINEDLQ